jgi:hypothetical protein
MPNVNLTSDQKAQLVGWLNREKDHLLSVKSMAEKIQVPKVTGTLELIRNDLEFVVRVRAAIRETDDNTPVEISTADSETLVDVARDNTYANREEFWKGVIDAVERSSSKEPKAQ